ncbi:conserved protein of unknown function (plasmid) [Pararobbsia alpina]|uniref:hypothetical protein n=1 Tax=Pararobbsia alpina TaxID=621374 RepID=UPI0039A4F2BD
MRQIQWLEAARHWVGATLHWNSIKAAIHDAVEQEGELQWVIAYETASGFCCLYKGEARDFADVEEVRAWASEVDVRVYFIGL